MRVSSAARPAAHGSSGVIPHPCRLLEIRGQRPGRASVRQKDPKQGARPLPTQAAQFNILEIVRALAIGTCYA